MEHYVLALRDDPASAEATAGRRGGGGQQAADIRLRYSFGGQGEQLAAGRQRTDDRGETTVVFCPMPCTCRLAFILAQPHRY
ncbi:MAG: hypothetical protein PVH57_05825 [Syntrophobacterales bacterium]|jgi:hypothetical protein